MAMEADGGGGKGDVGSSQEGAGRGRRAAGSGGQSGKVMTLEALMGGGERMIEVEVKSRLDDRRALERLLRRMGAGKGGDEVEKDVYFNHPLRDFANTDEALRIRSFGGGTTLTYKGPKLDRASKSREEIIIAVDDLKRTAALLERLGFRKVAAVRKRRRSFRLGKFEICVDSVEGLGDFFEIEAQAPKKGYARVRDEALELLVKLGGKRPETRSYLEMLLAGEPENR